MIDWKGANPNDKYNRKYDGLFHQYVFYQLNGPLGDFLGGYMGIHPNIITITGCLIKIIACIYFLERNPGKYFLLSFISYLLDCTDGYVARKYNMTSNFGAFLDALADLISIVINVLSMYYYTERLYFWILISIPVLFMYLIRLAIEEEIVSKIKSLTLGPAGRIKLYESVPLYNFFLSLDILPERVGTLVINKSLWINFIGVDTFQVLLMIWPFLDLILNRISVHILQCS